MIKGLIFAYVIIGALYFLLNVWGLCGSIIYNSIIGIMPIKHWNGKTMKDLIDETWKMVNNNSAKFAIFAFVVSFIGGVIWPVTIIRVITKNS